MHTPQENTEPEFDHAGIIPQQQVAVIAEQTKEIVSNVFRDWEEFHRALQMSAAVRVHNPR